jgi:antitoxin component YwqK of YwqJK toxin-antitoxin module
MEKALTNLMLTIPMKYLIVIVCCLMPRVMHAQVEIPFYGATDDVGRILRNDSSLMLFVPLSDSTRSVSISSSLKEYKVYDKNKQLLAEGELWPAGRGHQLARNGKWTEYYKNGNIKHTGYYYANQAIGTWKSYYQNGQIRQVNNYGEIWSDSAVTYCKVGSYEEYYENGKPMVMGFYRVVYDTFIPVEAKTIKRKRVTIKARAARSQPGGVWTYFKESGEIERQEYLSIEIETRKFFDK